MKFVIQGRLAGLNEYVKACRSNVYQANDMKKHNQKAVKIAIKQAKLKGVEKYPISLKITWYEPNNKRDIDNVCFGVKFILDAMVHLGIIPDDSRKFVKKITHEVMTDTKNPRIEVEIL